MATETIDVAYVADLARLELAPEEVAIFQKQLSDILGYVKKLEEMNVDGIDPSLPRPDNKNHLRLDAAGQPLGVETVLKNAPQASSDLIVVPKVVE
jgi:aspartyl-tRNA(Asn)/glutamyl-tRNA(Gln) amidotransferase subunit C